MGTGWNLLLIHPSVMCIITDWDMGTGWNAMSRKTKFSKNYNRLGYGYWLELLCIGFHPFSDYNRLGYGYWLEPLSDALYHQGYYNRLGYGYWLEL